MIEVPAEVEPGMLRRCRWPGCPASFLAHPGPTDQGWTRDRVAGVLLCPEHSEAGHRLLIDVKRNPDGSFLSGHGRCSCGEVDNAETRRNTAEFIAWWSQHVEAA